MTAPATVSFSDIRQWIEWANSVGIRDGHTIPLADLPKLIAANRLPST